ELRQTTCDADAAESALENYLRKLVAISRPHVAAHYDELRPDGSKVLHVFARTPATPPDWYYRSRATTGSWTAWQTLKLDITAPHLFPTVWDRRLHLIWPVFKQFSERQKDQQVPTGGGNSQPPPQKFWAVEFAFSEFSAGQWQAKRTIAEKVFLNKSYSDPS